MRPAMRRWVQPDRYEFSDELDGWIDGLLTYGAAQQWNSARRKEKGAMQWLGVDYDYEDDEDEDVVLDTC